MDNITAEQRCDELEEIKRYLQRTIRALREENERLEAERDAWREEAIERAFYDPSEADIEAVEYSVAARLQQKEGE